MRRLIYFLLATTMIMAIGACSKNDDMPDCNMPDNNVIWDIYPASVFVNIVDEEGNNLLDPTIEGNWIDEPMWIEYADKAFDVVWTKEDLPFPSRAIMPHFYGAVWSGVWTDKNYSIYFGEFDGASSRTLNLTFGIIAINTVYKFEYSHSLIWENKKPHFDDHITYNGKQIEGNTLTLVLPKRQ